MANLCFDEITVYGDKDKVKTIYDFLTGLQEELHINQIPLSYIKESLDFSEYDGDLRYFIDSVELKDDKVIITAELANTAHEEFFDYLADNFDVDYCIYADYADEGSKAVINDPQGYVYPQQYVLEVWDTNDFGLDEENYYFNDDIELKEFCKEHNIPDDLYLGTDFDDFDFDTDFMSLYKIDRDFSARGYKRQDNYAKFLETEEKEEIER